MKKKVARSEVLFAKGSGGCQSDSEEDSSPRTRQCNRSSSSSSSSRSSSNNNNNSGSANEEIVQPEMVVESAEASFPSAGLNNLLEQLTTKHKQNYRTESCPEEFDEEELVVGRRKWWGAKCHQQRNSRIAAAASGAAAGSALRPAKLAWLLMTSVLLFSVLVVPVAVVQGDEIRPNLEKQTSKGGVCGSVDVRNSPAHLDRLKDCVVVEGFVHILLIDKYVDSSFENYSFPLLTEITEYLLLFRVNGLKTLRRLFPNLAVIRGDVLVGDYAMVIYELMHIEEIGLVSLADITRGGVRIEKNPKLCFANTIDWKSMTVPGTTNYVKDNQKDNVCPICPTETSLILPNGTRNTQKCPVVFAKGGNKDHKKTLCWNANNCQNICPENCPSKSCSTTGSCCNETCLGGCSGPDGSDCAVCRHLSIDPAGERRCVTKCPEGMYKYHTRCVSYEECYSMKKPITLDSNADLPDTPFIPHNGTCTMDCPLGYEQIKNETKVDNKAVIRRWCKKCVTGNCPKKCEGSSIDNTQSAQLLKGCEIITGSLEIQLRSRGGENIVKELENFLSSITEIHGYLKIVRSYPLLSLRFLKKLRIIHGHEKVSNSTLYVVENQNLQELFDHNNITIGGDKMFFYNNPMLCTDKIKALKTTNPHIMIENEDQLGTNNGDRAACSITTLSTELKLVSVDTALIAWEPFTMLADARQLLGYVFYYIEAPDRNVTVFDGRDACNTEGWRLDDISDDKDTLKFLTQLKPFTQYAYYVKTYTLASEGLGGESVIKYFTTAPGTPSVVREVVALVVKDMLTVKWQPPLKMNGQLREYEVFVELNPDDNEQLKTRNYCDDAEKVREIIPETPTIPPTQKSSMCTEALCRNYCKSPSSGDTSGSIDATDKENQITFEDQLHNYIYIKNPTVINDKQTRRKRSSSILFPINTESKKNVTTDRRTEKVPGEHYYRYMFNVTNDSTISFPLNFFNHYSMYVVKIRACRYPGVAPAPNVKLVDVEDACGNEVIANVRTPKKPGADDIPPDSILVEEQSNNTQRVIKVQWREPAKPNGPIVKFSVKYQRVDLDSVSATEKCIPYSEFNNSGFTFLSKLEPGNYSIRVMATTIAGDGAYSAARYVYLKKDDSESSTMILLVCLAIVFVFFIASLLFYFYKYHYAPKQIRMYPDVNPDYAGVIYKVDEWEVERHHILQLEELGQGSFGMVYKGILSQRNGESCNLPCAIKTVNESATAREKDSFLMEASVMKQFHTHHVVRLLGVVSQGDPTLVIMELMVNGDLKSYLRRHRPDYENGNEPSPQPPTLKAIIQMAIEIADGMAYLSAKKFVHRDLAARNCMVAEDMTVKIGDFGMTRDIYETDYYRKGTKGFLPVRWMSPESLKDGVFSSSSDVFSYGVVMWEMATLASQPYQGLTNDQVLRYVIEGGVMERPENCPDSLYELMRRCWQHRPTARPTFIEIISLLLPDASPRFLEVSFYNSQDALDMAPVLHQIIMDDVTTPLHPGGDHDEEDEDDDRDGEEEAMHVGDVGTDDEFSMEMTNSHLVRNNGPMATIRSPHSPLR
ncbi:insulin-like receptor isoform X2 [Ochlerotatus camptorhynchus]|uniref:insulin-like receptor isoform X2 n=1 Tax=Ochlerotatus camptorhynchus TaxID=644619 RepID=UPI0031CFB1C2